MVVRVVERKAYNLRFRKSTFKCTFKFFYFPDFSFYHFDQFWNLDESSFLFLETAQKRKYLKVTYISTTSSIGQN